MSLPRGARFALAALLALTACGCASRTIGPPPDAPRVTRPLDAMPADLDLVLRLDLQKIRATLGATAMSAIGEQAVASLRGSDRATDQLLLGALATTDTLWLGLRPTRSVNGADNVFVLSGKFTGFDPHKAESTPRFRPALDLGGDLRRYDRDKPGARSAPARIYVRGDDLVVSLSEAEIDSVERRLEEENGMPPLEPAEKGVLSAVARPRVLPASLFVGSAALRRLANHAEQLELNADLTGAGVDATLSLRFEDESQAEQVAGALSELLAALRDAPGRLARLSKKLQLTHAQRFVSVRLGMTRDEFAELVNCRGSGCTW